MTIQFDESLLSDIPSSDRETKAFPKIEPLPTTDSVLSWHKTGQDTVPSELREQVRQYRRWLAQQSTIKSDARERAEYALNASRTVQLDGKEIATFAPFRPELFSSVPLSWHGQWEYSTSS